ncbi:MAG: hypothetical protein IT293_18775 [Deltaproteobacteria bacterium]|nr:hypothetical protein [Deltaproteobacteria bacterium]
MARYALVAALAACSKPSLPGDLTVADITTGRELASDGRIRDDARTNMFWTTDTFYVAVQTDGSADNVTMVARWSGPENAKAEVSKTLSPKGPTTTTFEAPPPDGRWPAGDYQVEILVNGGSQGTRDLNTR